MKTMRSHNLNAVLKVNRIMAHAKNDAIINSLLSITHHLGLTVLGSVTAQLDPGGGSVVILLAESHVAVHTWPELRVVTVDIHVCDYTRNNKHVAWKLAAEICGLWNVLFSEDDWNYSSNCLTGVRLPESRPKGAKAL